MAIVKSCPEKINVPFDKDNIDHVHRVGIQYTDENTGKKMLLIIVKLKLQKSRKKFYDSRQRNFINDKRKLGPNLLDVSIDPTRKYYLLLKTAKGLGKLIPILVSFEFKNGSFKYFNSLNELHNFL